MTKQDKFTIEKKICEIQGVSIIELQIMTGERDFWKAIALALFTTNILYCVLKALF